MGFFEGFFSVFSPSLISSSTYSFLHPSFIHFFSVHPSFIHFFLVHPSFILHSSFIPSFTHHSLLYLPFTHIPSHPAALPEENFKFSWDKVTLGDDQRNPFVGHLQNFIIDDQHYFNFIDSPNPDLQIYTSVKTSDREQPIIVSPITIHRDSNAHFALPPLQVTGDSKLQVMFKTTESDGIILYNPGAQEDFLAGRHTFLSSYWSL